MWFVSFHHKTNILANEVLCLYLLKGMIANSKLCQ